MKNVAKVRPFLSQSDAEKLHATVTSRVDHCNDLLTGLPKKTAHLLQLVQNAAAQIRTKTKQEDHITPALKPH